MRSLLLLPLLAVAACSGGEKGAEVVATGNDVATEAAAVSPPPGGDWSGVVSATPSGGYVMGNPAAAVKLIEIASLSCPYCRQFEETGVPPLVDNYVKTGKVSWEFRPYLIHGPIDLTANLIARCNGPAGFFPIAKAFYKDQQALVGKVETAPKEKQAALQNLPPERAFVEMAALMGLQQWAAARGIPHAKSSACLTNQQMIDAEVQAMNDVNTEFPGFSGTPSFVVNGKLLPREQSNWAALEPALKAALR